MGTVPGQNLGDRRSDPSRAPCDQRHPTVEWAVPVALYHCFTPSILTRWTSTRRDDWCQFNLHQFPMRSPTPQPPCRDSNPDHRPMACPRLGKVDRRLVQARHSLFDLALTLPPAPTVVRRLGAVQTISRLQGVGRPLPARTCPCPELAVGMGSRVIPSSTRGSTCSREAARSARAFPAIGTLALQPDARLSANAAYATPR